MKKVFKFVKGKKDERKESGGITPSQSGDLISPAQTPEDEKFLGLDNSSGYAVDFGGKDKTLTKLHKAAWQGNLEKLKSALKKIEVDAVDKHNRTALHFAVAQGHPNIVWFLLGNNAKTSISDDEGHTPLLKAVECGHKECMTLLLDRGAEVNVSDYTGNTGLHIAVSQASLDTVSALLKKGADTDVSNNAGDYPLHIATRLENKDLVDMILGSGASVDVLDRENRTPLMLAAKTGNRLLTQVFVEHGAQLTVVDSNGWTAQDYAMLGGHESIAASLKLLIKTGGSDVGSNDNSGSWGESQTESSEKGPITQKLKKFFNKCSEEEAETSVKEKNEEMPESPDVEVIPPYCQPPRSWEMIQAGMIDEKNDGSEPKRRSITTLGTLHSRRESFTETSSSSPQFTLSLNRRKGAKTNNAFAKQRFSFNEEESLKYWINEEKTIRKDLEKIELENILNLHEVVGGHKRQSASESDWDSLSVENSQDSKKAIHLGSTEDDSQESQKNSEGGTLGKEGTMNEVEEIWVFNPLLSPGRNVGDQKRSSWDSEDPGSEKEGNFPPPPTALELGVDMAKSIKYIKGISMDQPAKCGMDKNHWKNFYESHSLDCLEERDVEPSKGAKSDRRLQSALTKSGEDVFKFQKPRDRLMDVNSRINEQLECYDQALRELAESSKLPSQSYHSLPSTKTGGAGEYRRANSQEWTSSSPLRHVDGGSHSLPFCPAQWPVENNEKLGQEDPPKKPSEEAAEDKLRRSTRRHMLLAMRDVKHAVHVTNSFKSSMDDQILSPLALKTEDSFDLNGKSSEETSPADENPFFEIGRQETVLESNDVGRKSSSSGTGEESTLWLQDEAQRKGAPCPGSDDEVSEIATDEKSKHRRVSSFSPLGIIQREMEEESKGNAFDSEQPLTKHIRGENEEQTEEGLRDQSPDISLSSGPIEPIGTEKDSGSEPESSHNDASPSHTYALKNQHEWLKCHLKAATLEKNKLEELTAQLTEKAERLQYELADAKEAAKSRDEVIKLLQDQLARMEAAYTKSLEESVQSRLQLTSHEQEILHLKELCYRYEEEKEASAVGGDAFLQELQLKIKALEEEKDKMKKKIIHLEEEKSVLEERLKQEKNEEPDMKDSCQRWKERCGKLEEMVKAFDSKQAAYESYVKEKDREFLEQENQFKRENFFLEKKSVELSEENIELKEKIQNLTAELTAERIKSAPKDETRDIVTELKRKNAEMENRLKNLEKEMEEKMLKKLKEKEEEVGILVKQFNHERDSLVASYEKLMAGRSEQSFLETDDWKKENQHLRQMVENLQAQVGQLQISAGCKNEWNLISESEGNVKTEIQELKSQVSSLRMLLDGEGAQKNLGKRFNQRPEPRRREVGKEDELAWSSLYGMKATRRRRGGRSTSVTETLMKNRDVEGSSDEGIDGTKKPKPSGENILNRLNAAAEQETEMSQKIQKLELLELKKEILILQSKMSDEKNFRHALKNQMIKMNLDLSDKENLEKEVISLKKKVDRDCLRRSEIELLEYQKDLEAKREKFLGGSEGKIANDNIKAKCEILAKEREKTKEIRNSFGRRAKSFDCPLPEPSSQSTFQSGSRPLPEIFLRPRFVALDPDVKNRLEHELDRSIRKYMHESFSTPSISNVPIDFIKKKYF